MCRGRRNEHAERLGEALGGGDARNQQHNDKPTFPIMPDILVGNMMTTFDMLLTLVMISMLASVAAMLKMNTTRQLALPISVNTANSSMAA